MTEQELIRRLRDERPAPPAGFEERQDKLLLSLTQKEEKPIMKRKMSAALIFALVLVLLSVSAFAASLMFSPRYDAGKLANQALLEKYGITEKMMTVFYREITENEEGTVTVRYLPNDDSNGVDQLLGVYTVTVRNGKAEAVWSLDGEEMTDDLASLAWGAAQLEKMVTDYSAAMQYLSSHSPQGEAPDRPQPTPMPAEQVAQYEQEARSRAKLSGAECKQIAMAAITSEYGLTEAQAKLLYPVYDDQADGMYYTMEDGRPVGVLIFQLWQGHESWTEKDGHYVVRINVETGVIEDMIYDSGLAANG